MKNGARFFIEDAEPSIIFIKCVPGKPSSYHLIRCPNKIASSSHLTAKDYLTLDTKYREITEAEAVLLS